MLLGCHLSIGGGLYKAIERAEELGINALQIFSHSARSWQMKPLSDGDAEEFRTAWAESSVEYVVVHTSYLINLASPKEEIYAKSIDALRGEISRAGRLGISHVNTHVGAHLRTGVEAGIERIVRALDEVLTSSEAEAHPGVKLLLENDAGAGTSLGARFDELAVIIDNGSNPERLGVCFDTCHGFAAGYDFTTDHGLEAMLQQLDRAVGVERLKLVHVNDSTHPRGSRKDRHEHIGQGQIGLEGFRLLVNHPSLRDLPFVLETPKAPHEGNKLNSDMDPVNLRTIRELRGEESPKGG